MFLPENILEYLIEKYPNKQWDWYYISRNPNITMEIIDKYPYKPWNWYGISKNPNITLGVIEKNIGKIDFLYLSNNKFIFHNKLVRKRHMCKNIYCLWYINRDIKQHMISTYLI